MPNPQLLESRLVMLDLLKIKVDAILFIFANFTAGGSLLHRKAVGGMVIEINKGKSGNFLAFFRTTGCSAPESIDAITLLPTFGDKRTINGRYLLVMGGDGFFNEPMVKVGKIKGFAKLAQVGHFAQITVTTEIAEVHSASQNQDR